ncbi:hypothetical protein NM688_g4143 [Phlebia brevispora]|uniref:Uncharacterized protein n=1 Tax=Phlebia brevispora TaxID=194682 RepID=A0ACC1T3Y6_9APHY|nr:hypothetical protein NM688_g4143 [Phlebia brevispora]
MPQQTIVYGTGGLSGKDVHIAVAEPNDPPPKWSLTAGGAQSISTARDEGTYYAINDGGEVRGNLHETACWQISIIKDLSDSSQRAYTVKISDSQGSWTLVSKVPRTHVTISGSQATDSDSEAKSQSFKLTWSTCRNTEMIRRWTKGLIDGTRMLHRRYYKKAEMHAFTELQTTRSSHRPTSLPTALLYVLLFVQMSAVDDGVYYMFHVYFNANIGYESDGSSSPRGAVGTPKPTQKIYHIAVAKNDAKDVEFTITTNDDGLSAISLNTPDDGTLYAYNNSGFVMAKPEETYPWKITQVPTESEGIVNIADSTGQWMLDAADPGTKISVSNGDLPAFYEFKNVPAPHCGLQMTHK